MGSTEYGVPGADGVLPDVGRVLSSVNAVLSLSLILAQTSSPAQAMRLVGERVIRNLRDDLTVLLDAQHAVVGDVADARRVQIPLFEDPLDFRLAMLKPGDKNRLVLEAVQHAG